MIAPPPAVAPAILGGALALAVLLAACGSAPAPAWRPLFDGRSLAGFTPVQFGGEGRVHVADSCLVLEPGSPLTGVTATPDLPAEGYELAVVAERLLGNDFFCAITFPVAGSHLTLVVGGWGGAVCGLSSLDGLDAAHNGTRTLRHVPTGTACRIHLRVFPDRVEADLDSRELVRCDLRGHSVGLRAEMEPTVPFGLCAYACRSAIAEVAWRPLR